jgi:hypothetical protein
MKLDKLSGASALFASMLATAHARTVVTSKVKNATTAPAAYACEYFPEMSLRHRAPSCRLIRRRFQVNPTTKVTSWATTGDDFRTNRSTRNANIAAVQAVSP